MDKFIYVFNEGDRDILVSSGYILLYSNPETNTYIFENNTQMCFSFDNMIYTTSNTLKF